ncbi:MAG: hypothetical protein J5726_07370 [Treponema sp.]|nr:hypothetical protein [Treponema sp.]
MKKLLCAVAVFGLMLSAASAYNPPVYGDDIFELSSPRQLANASSVVGGGLFYASPESIIVNPALTAKEQRVDLNLAYTGLISTNKENSMRYGNAFQGGILIPTKRFVFSGYLNGTMVPFKEMYLGNSFDLKLGLAKEITDKLTLGIGLNSGIFWGADTDWGISANLGFVYTYGDLGFVKDFRYGASILNLGKNFSKTTMVGIKGAEKGTATLPMIATVKAGAAGTLVSNDIIKLGASFDLTLPAFMNVIADLGLQFSVKDMLFISVAEKINVAELACGVKNVMPSVGLSFRFTFDVKNNDYLQKNGWSQSEMSASVAWKQFNKTVNAVSAGVDVNLGLKDETPPVIKLWLDEEDEKPAEVQTIPVVGDAK